MLKDIQQYCMVGIPLWCLVFILATSTVRYVYASEISAIVLVIIFSLAGIGMIFQVIRTTQRRAIWIIMITALVVFVGAFFLYKQHAQEFIEYQNKLVQGQDTYVIVVKQKLFEDSKNATYQGYFKDSHIAVSLVTPRTYFYNDTVTLRGKLVATKLSPVRTRFRLQEKEVLSRSSTLLGKLVHGAQEHLSGIYQQYLQEETLGITEGIVLGVQHHIPYWFNSLFREVGISHIIVLSGYNILLVYEGLFLIGRRFLNRTTIVAISLIFSYVLVMIAGNTEASARAYQSIVLHEVLRVLGIVPSIERTVLYLLVYVVLVTKTPVNDHVGLMLSCGATLGIVYTMRIYARIMKKYSVAGFAQGIFSAIVTTIGAWLGTLPIIIGYFGVVTPGGMVMSLLVIPIVFMYTTVGIGFLFVGMLVNILPFFKFVLVWVAWMLTKMTKIMIHLGVSVRYHIPSFELQNGITLGIVIVITTFFVWVALTLKNRP